MTLDGSLEVYLLLYAWRQYEAFWSILAWTGIVYAPFVWLLAENVLQGAKHSETGSEAAVASRRPILVDLGIALLVIALAGAPFATLQTASLSYVSPCYEDREGGPGSTGTTYDTAFTTPETAPKAPLWWKLVLAVSYGLTRAGIESIGCPQDLTLVRQKVDETRIRDPGLVAELLSFRQQCFYPARSQFQALLQNPFFQSQWQQIQEAGLIAHVDLEWEGSKVYRATTFDFSADDGDRIQLKQPIYDTLHAEKPIPGFAIDPTRDSDLDYLQKVQAANQAAVDTGYQAPAPLWGLPSCNQWWSGSNGENGLRTRLLALYEKSIGETMGELWSRLTTDKTQEQMEDELLMGLVINEYGVPYEASFIGSNYIGDGDYGLWSAITESLTNAASNLGLAWEKVSVAPMLNAIKAALPIIKALLLMAVIIFIPIILVASAYRLEVVFLITVGLVSINFLSVIWSLAWVLENQLLNALWPDQTNIIAQVKYTYESVDTNWSLKVEVLKFLLPFLYLFLPFIFFAVIGWAGIRVFVGIAAAIGALTNPTQQGGRAAADVMKRRAGG